VPVASTPDSGEIADLKRSQPLLERVDAVQHVSSRRGVLESGIARPLIAVDLCVDGDLCRRECGDRKDGGNDGEEIHDDCGGVVCNDC